MSIDLGPNIDSTHRLALSYRLVLRRALETLGLMAGHVRDPASIALFRERLAEFEAKLSELDEVDRRLEDDEGPLIMLASTNFPGHVVD